MKGKSGNRLPKKIRISKWISATSKRCSAADAGKLRKRSGCGVRSCELLAAGAIYLNC